MSTISKEEQAMQEAREASKPKKRQSKTVTEAIEIVPEVITADEANKLVVLTQFEIKAAQMKKDYAGLKIIDINDKKGAEAVIAARKKTKQEMVELEKERVKLVTPAVTFQKEINRLSNKLKALFEEVRDPLEKMETEHLLAVQKAKDEEARLKRQVIQYRASVILQTGATFDGVYYKLLEATISQSQIEDLSDDDFNLIYNKFLSTQLFINEEKLAAELARQEEADRLEAQKKQQEEEAIELLRQQAELKAEKERIAKEQSDLAEAQKQLRIAQRRSRLEALGGKEDIAEGHFSYRGATMMDSLDFYQLPDEEFEVRIADLPAQIATWEQQLNSAHEAEIAEKARIEKEKLAEIEKIEQPSEQNLAIPPAVRTANKAKKESTVFTVETPEDFTEDEKNLKVLINNTIYSLKEIHFRTEKYNLTQTSLLKLLNDYL